MILSRTVTFSRELHYPGDCRDIIGQVVGPTMLGEFYAVAETDYDPAADRTTARLRFATSEEAGSR